jgi:hypothetical protein
MASRCSARFGLSVPSALAALLLAALGLAAGAAADGSACVHAITADGTVVTAAAGVAGPALSPGAFDSRDYLWRSVHAGWIGASTAISLIPEREDVMVGHNNAPPTQVEFFPAAGPGVPHTTFPAREAQVAAHDGVYAAADLTSSSGNITLTVWYLDLSTPVFTMALPGATFGDYDNTLQVNMDATRVFFTYFQGGQVWFLVVDATTGTKLVQTMISITPASVRGLACSDDGRFAVLNCGATHVVYDVDLGTERGRINTGASTDPTAISETGEWVAAGFTTCKAYQWDPGTQTYVTRWVKTAGARYLGVNMISERGYWIVGWYSGSFNQNKLQRYSMETGTLLWTIDMPTSSGAVQDLPVAIDFSRSRSVIAVGCWGDTQPVSPEILAFSPEGEELASLHATGSMYDVAVSSDGRYVSGTGKLVHANIFGSGSDTYCMYSGDLTAVHDGGDPLAGPALRLAASPNPCHGSAVIRAQGPSASGEIVRILDSSGRLVSTLALGPSGAAWDGTNRCGQSVAAGIYYATLATPSGLVRAPVLLVR